MRKALLFVAIAAASLLGCGNKDASGSGSAAAGSGAPAMSGAPGASGAAATGPGCAGIGCGNKKGDFFEPCDCKGKAMTPPLVAKWTGKVDSFYKRASFSVENTSDKDIHWGSVAVYYYDKSGKQVEVELKDRKEKFKAARSNGSNFTFKPKEKKELSLGWDEKSYPKDVAKIEVVFDGWCYGTYDDKASHLCVNVDRAPDDRPPAN